MATIQQIDLYILNFIQEYLHNSFLSTIMIFLSNIGNNGYVWIFIAVLLLPFRKYRKYGMLILIALVMEFLTVEAFLKPLVHRIRPFNINEAIDILVNLPGSYSFPSGHTASSFAAATVLLHSGKKLGIPSIILAALIAFSRLYLYVHFPSDVIAGAIMGVLCGLAAIIGVRKFVLFI